MPEERRQFRVLYRDFLSRMVDLEILSTGGDVQKLLVQFAAMLAAFSFTYAVASVPRYVQSTLPQDQLLVAAWSEQEFLIATTMAIAGLFGVLAWNTVLPDRRDAWCWACCRCARGPSSWRRWRPSPPRWASAWRRSTASPASPFRSSCGPDGEPCGACVG